MAHSFVSWLSGSAVRNDSLATPTNSIDIKTRESKNSDIELFKAMFDAKLNGLENPWKIVTEKLNEEFLTQLGQDGPVYSKESIAYAKQLGLIGRIINTSRGEYCVTLSEHDKMDMLCTMHMTAIDRVGSTNVAASQFPLIATLGFDLETKTPYVFTTSKYSLRKPKAQVSWGSLSDKMIEAIKGRDMQQPQIVTRSILVRTKYEMYSALIAWELDLLQWNDTFDPCTFKTAQHLQH